LTQHWRNRFTIRWLAAGSQAKEGWADLCKVYGMLQQKGLGDKAVEYRLLYGMSQRENNPTERGIRKCRNARITAMGLIQWRHLRRMRRLT
jgi:hypothetical protein